MPVHRGPLWNDVLKEGIPGRTPGTLGSLDAGDPDRRCQPGPTQGPLGTNGDHATAAFSPTLRSDGTVLASDKASKAAEGKADAPAAKGHKESVPDSFLNLYGSYPYSANARALFKSDDIIRKRIRDWFPSTTELKAFASAGPGEVEGVADWETVLCCIAAHKPTRVNFFIHGNDSGQSYFRGTVVVGNVEFITTGQSDRTLLDAYYPTNLESNDLEVSDKARNRNNITWKTLRAAMKNLREVYIYSCHGGVDKAALNDLAKFFKATVYAFGKEVWYYPLPATGGKITGWEYAIEDGAHVRRFVDLSEGRVNVDP